MKIPAEWQEVLQKIHAVYPSAIIAGGALRDLLHEKPVKDVDIFIPVTEWYEVSEASDYLGSNDIPAQHDTEFYKLNRLFPASNDSWDNNVKLKVSSLYGNSNLGRDVMAVYTLRIQDVLYELIFIKQTPEQYKRIETTIEQFDLNICQIGFDGLYTFTTPAFEKALTEKIIRVMNVNRLDRQKKRIARMLAKYPDYTVEDANENRTAGNFHADLRY